MQETTIVGSLGASIASLIIRTVSADVFIRQGEGSVVEISAQTPSFWKVSEDGTVTEIGGNVADALNTRAKFSIGRNISFSSSWIDGVLHINNRKVDVPKPLEQLVIYLPVGFAGEVDIEAEYLGAISVEAALAGKVKARVSSRASLNLVDQNGIKGANLGASLGASINAGTLYAGDGRVKISADLSSSVTTGAVMSGDYSAKTSTGAKLTGKGVRASGDVDLVSELSGSRIDLGSVSGANVSAAGSTSGRIVAKTFAGRELVSIETNTEALVEVGEAWANELLLEADMSGEIEIANADSNTFRAEAGMSGTVTVANGSAESGKAKADMSGRVRLTGDFAALKVKQDMGGKVTIAAATSVDGAVTDRFLRAAKRHFNRDLWGDVYAATIALSFGASIGPAMQQGMADVLSYPSFVNVVCNALQPTFRDADVISALKACGVAFSEALGGRENLNNPELVTAAIQQPAVLELYGKTFQFFLQRVMEHAQKVV